jgi:hypothetical protein
MKQINFVYSRNKLDFKKFAKLSSYDEVVSYHDIITKLVKNDNDNDRPSEYVVNSYLRRKIIKAMTDKNVVRIIYALKDLDYGIIISIRDLMVEVYSGEVEFNLTIIDHKKFEWNKLDAEEIDELPFLNKIDCISV